MQHLRALTTRYSAAGPPHNGEGNKIKNAESIKEKEGIRSRTIGLDPQAAIDIYQNSRAYDRPSQDGLHPGELWIRYVRSARAFLSFSYYSTSQIK